MHRIALIGCGAVAESGHLPALLRHPRFTVAAVCDLRRERADLLARRAGGVPASTDWQELLKRESVDAAVLALPPEASPDPAIHCLRRGIAVLDEKPLAATVEDGRHVARTAAETGTLFQIGFVLRYGDWVREVARRTRAIGTPARIRVAVYDERLDRTDAAHLARIQGFLRNSSAMTHEGSHVIDYAGLWNPAPWMRVRATAERTAADFAGPNRWHAVVDLADGSVLEMDIGWLLPELPPCTVAIEGPNGCLDLNLRSGSGQVRLGRVTMPLALPPLAPEWDRQYDAFAEALDRGVAMGAMATIADGLRALEVTTACEVSARTGAAVERRNIYIPRSI